MGKATTIPQIPGKPFAREQSQRVEWVRAIARQLLAAPYKLQTETARAETIDLPRAATRFFSQPAALSAKAKRIRRSCPTEPQRLRKTAGNILAHRFDLLGSGPVNLGATLDWHRDYQAMYNWPRDVDYTRLGRGAFDLLVDPLGAAELKFPWDLSNQMWIPSLAAAAAMTKDARYACGFRRDLQRWLDQNPFPLGVNWYCAMSVAIRAVNLIVGVTAFGTQLTPQLRRRVCGSLWRHGVFIAGNLEIEAHDFRNNHYLANIVGLYYLGWFFADLEIGRRWRDFARAELEAEAQHQFLSDGVCFENSTAYHRLSTEMLLICAIVGVHNGVPFSSKFQERLHRSLRFTADITPSNGLVPLFGDNDNGRMLQFFGFGCTLPRDHRHLLAVGGEFFDDPQLRRTGQTACADALWLVGRWGRVAKVDRAPGRMFRYPVAGYFGYRDREITWVVRNAQLRACERGGHAHCDALSFTLHVGGVDLIADAGTYRYSSDFAARNAFRSTAYHNTIQLNDWPQHDYDEATFEGLWRMRDRAAAETTRWRRIGRKIEFRGRIHSYSSRGWNVARRMVLDLDGRELVIRDEVTPTRRAASSGDVAYSRLLLGPDLRVARTDFHQVRVVSGRRLIATITAPAKHIRLRIRPLWVAPRYGERVPAQQLEFVWKPSKNPSVSIQISLGSKHA